MKKPPVRLLPVRFPAYQAIFQLNRSFEECIENLSHVRRLRLLQEENYRVYHVMIKEVRALANHELAGIINLRERENIAYYKRLRLQWLKDLEGWSAASDAEKPEKDVAPTKAPRLSKNQQKKKKVRR